MPSPQGTVVVLGTGGTIAGRAADAGDVIGYRAGEVAVSALLSGVPALASVPLEAQQVAQVDSKDMRPALWRVLAERAQAHLARPDMAGVVVTHGTDTLEETAWLLHRVLAPVDKPLVLTAAMRPATALMADGPQNLLDAVTLARTSGAHGVLAVLAGAVHEAGTLRKRHTLHLDAFDGGDAGPLARLDASVLQRLRPWPVPSAAPLGLDCLPAEDGDWPWVAVLANHAGADGREVQALVGAGVRGLVVAGTGNGTLSGPLQQALAQAKQAGVLVRRVSRCGDGPVRGGDPELAALAQLSPWQARVELQLALLAGVEPVDGGVPT